MSSATSWHVSLFFWTASNLVIKMLARASRACSIETLDSHGHFIGMKRSHGVPWPFQFFPFFRAKLDDLPKSTATCCQVLHFDVVQVHLLHFLIAGFVQKWKQVHHVLWWGTVTLERSERFVQKEHPPCTDPCVAQCLLNQLQAPKIQRSVQDVLQCWYFSWVVFIRLGFVDSLACGTIEVELSSWDGWACQLLTSEIQIKTWLNGYIWVQCLVMLLSRAFSDIRFFPILVFAQFAGDTSEMVVVTSGQSTQLLLRLVEFPDWHDLWLESKSRIAQYLLTKSVFLQ